MSSKKILIAVIAMVVLLGAAIGGYIAVDRAKKQEEDASSAEAASLQLFSFDENAVTGVIIDSDEGHFRIGPGDDGWQITETDYPHDILLNSYYITSLISNMSNLSAVQKLDAASDQRSAYGLDAPTVITCDLGNVSYTLSVGSASVTEECWYVMVNDTVYSIDYSTGALLRGGTEYLRNRDLLHYYDVDVTAFRLDHGSETVVDLAVVDGLWKMQAPRTLLMTDSAKVGSMITSLVRYEISSFEDVAQDSSTLAKYGLDKPAYTMTVKAGSDTTVLLFAPDNGTGNGMYVLEQSTGQIARMNSGNTGFLEMQPEELLSKNLIDLPFMDARSLEVQADDLAFTMQMDAAAGQYTLGNTDLNGAGTNVTALFRNLYDTIGNLSWEALTFDAQLSEAAEPDYTFRFRDAEGTETVLTLYRTQEDENLYLAYLNGSYTQATVRRRSLTGTTGVYNFYEKLMDELDAQGIAYEPPAAETEAETSEETESGEEIAETEAAPTDTAEETE